MEKQVGQPCPDCNTPFIQGAKGAYCKPCYVKWANENKPQNAPQRPQNTSNIPTDQFLTISQFNQTLDKMRSAFSAMQKEIKDKDNLIQEIGERLQILEGVVDEMMTKEPLTKQEQEMASALNIPIV